MTTHVVSHTPARKARALSQEDYQRFQPLVRRIAMRLARRLPSHIAVGDLVSSGWVGLAEAFSRSREGMPIEEIEAYASHRVKGAMLDYLRSLDPASREIRNASRRVARAIARFTAENKRSPREEEIAEAMDVSLEEYRATLTQIGRAGMARLEMIDIDVADPPGDRAQGPDELASKRMLSELVADAIECLPLRLQNVISLYYKDECTLREIGGVLGVSESRASQLHTEAMHRLRAAIGSA